MRPIPSHLRRADHALSFLHYGPGASLPDDDALWRRLVEIPFAVPVEKQDPSVRERLSDPKGTCRRCCAGSSEFLADRCVLSPTAWTPIAGLRHAYEAWAEENGERPLRGKTFAAALRRHGCTHERKYVGRGWRGVGLRAGQDPA